MRRKSPELGTPARTCWVRWDMINLWLNRASSQTRIKCPEVRRRSFITRELRAGSISSTSEKTAFAGLACRAEMRHLILINTTMPRHGSHAKAKYASVVVWVDREFVQNMTGDPAAAKIYVLKNRDGKIGPLPATFS